jgi:hypothetical protein
MNGSENSKNDSSQEINNEDKLIIIFALGRAYKWCQFNGLEDFGGIPKNKFFDLAKRLGAEIT